MKPTQRSILLLQVKDDEGNVGTLRAIGYSEGDLIHFITEYNMHTRGKGKPSLLLDFIDWLHFLPTHNEQDITLTIK